MSTKAVKSNSYIAFGVMTDCAWCGARFNNSKTFKTSRPVNICPWCWWRGLGELRRKMIKMSKALDTIANLACVKGSDDPECKCPTCFAGRVYDEVWQEKNDAKEPGPTEAQEETGHVHSGAGHDHSGGVPTATETLQRRDYL